MTFRSRNAYYLRISTNIVLPLFLYLDERHTDWMSDVVLQHVLADLRPLIVPKLQAEKDIHFGLGTVLGDKRGTVEVHRGETYQFAYFFRKTGPHTVLIKSRYFVAPRPRPDVTPEPTPSSHLQAARNPRNITQVSAKHSKRKRAQSKGKGKSFRSRLDEDEWFAEKSEEDAEDADLIPREPHPVRKQRRITTDAYEENDDNVEDMRPNDPMNSPGMDGEPCNALIIEDGDPTTWDTNDEPFDTADVKLVVEEEETKPKPLFKLKHQSFPITGHCLCVVVEPWPPLRAEPMPSVDVRMPRQSGGLSPSIHRSNGPIIAEQRAKTPLFFPECDRAPIEVSFAREKNPPVSLFHADAVSRTEFDEYSDNDLMSFSQTLNAGGHMHAIAAEDDDDMEGTILFGDADEVRELF